MIVNISEAKTNLSKLIDMVYHGQEVIIAKNNLPIVDLVIHKPKGKRKLGLLKGTILIVSLIDKLPLRSIVLLLKSILPLVSILS